MVEANTTHDSSNDPRSPSNRMLGSARNEKADAEYVKPFYTMRLDPGLRDDAINRERGRTEFAQNSAAGDCGDDGGVDANSKSLAILIGFFLLEEGSNSESVPGNQPKFGIKLTLDCIEKSVSTISYEKWPTLPLFRSIDELSQKLEAIFGVVVALLYSGTISWQGQINDIDALVAEFGDEIDTDNELLTCLWASLHCLNPTIEIPGMPPRSVRDLKRVAWHTKNATDYVPNTGDLLLNAFREMANNTPKPDVPTVPKDRHNDNHDLPSDAGTSERDQLAALMGIISQLPKNQELKVLISETYSGEEKMRRLIALDRAYTANESADWGQLIRVKPATVRGYKTWTALQSGDKEQVHRDCCAEFPEY